MARQLIVHGHIAVGDRKVTIPGYKVLKNEEESVNYAPNSPIANELHPMRVVGQQQGNASEQQQENRGEA